MTANLAVIVPTYNERDNVGPLVERLTATLHGISWEVVFVDDDSPDGTADIVRELGRSDPRVRCLQRIGRRGLASACVEGALATAAPVLAVMDADLQHDEGILPEMLQRLTEGNDIVVGSRFAADGSVGAFSRNRTAITRMGTRLSRMVLGHALSDPMSGFFLMRRDVFEQTVRRLSGRGFKILLDIFASSPRPLAFAEVGDHFRLRQAGESKLSTQVMLDYLILLAEKLVDRCLPIRMVLYGLVGMIGLAIHLAVLGSLFKFAGLPFAWSQGVAIVTAMTSNFFLNNRITYRDRPLRGWQLLPGLMSFYAACALGGGINYAVADMVRGVGASWWFAGLSGAVVGAVWNFTVTGLLTWNERRRFARV